MMPRTRCASSLSRSLAGVDLWAAKAGRLKDVDNFQLDPDHIAFAEDPGWGDAFDDLRSPCKTPATLGMAAPEQGPRDQRVIEHIARTRPRSAA